MIGRREIVGVGAAALIAGGFADAKACTINGPRKVDEARQRVHRIGAVKKFIKHISSKDWGGMATLMSDEPWSLNGKEIEPSDAVNLKGAVTEVLLSDFVSFEFQDAAVLADRVFASAMLWFNDDSTDCGAGPFGRQNYLSFAFRDQSMIKSVDVTNG